MYPIAVVCLSYPLSESIPTMSPSSAILWFFHKWGDYDNNDLVEGSIPSRNDFFRTLTNIPIRFEVQIFVLQKNSKCYTRDFVLSEMINKFSYQYIVVRVMKRLSEFAVELFDTASVVVLWSYCSCKYDQIPYSSVGRTVNLQTSLVEGTIPCRDDFFMMTYLI